MKAIGKSELNHHWRFAREDEQILALNYENLCDSDYLSRLFISDGANEESKSNEQASNLSEAGGTAQELAEDVVVFGKDLATGKQLFQRRLERDIILSCNTLDPFAYQISRQVLVFEHMARLMTTKVLSPNAATSSIPHATFCRSNVDGEQPRPFSAIALQCCLSIISSDTEVDYLSTTIQPVIISLIQFFNPEMWSNPISNSVISSSQKAQLRTIFGQCSRRLTKIRTIELTNWQPRQFQDNIRTVLCGIYGHLALGMLCGSSSDIVVAINQLIMLMIITEERVELMLSQIQDLINSSTSSTKTNRVPTKVKAAQKFNQKANSSTPGERTIPDEQIFEMKLIDDDCNRPKGDRTSASKSKEKALYHQKDLVKGKLVTKTSKSETKMLHEFLEKSTDITVNIQPVIVANHVAVSFGAKSKSNNRDKETTEQQKSTAVVNPRTNFKKIEKDIKNVFQASVRLPKAILQMMNDYCTIVDGNLSTKRVLASPTNRTPSNTNQTKSIAVASQVKSNNTQSTYVWSCGQNSYGELGLGDNNVRKSFSKISCLDTKCIISIGAGNEHSLFVTSDGKLLTAGYNDNGQCGIGSTQQVRQPAVVQALEDEEIQQVFVFNGCEHTIAVSRDGKVYAFGYNYRGQVCFVGIQDCYFIILYVFFCF
jgi:hypothetical protein